MPTPLSLERFEPLAIVLNRDTEAMRSRLRRPCLLNINSDLRCAGMARGIVDCLLHYPVNTGSMFIRQIIQRAFGSHIHMDSAGAGHFAGEPFQRGKKPEIIKHSGAQE